MRFLDAKCDFHLYSMLSLNLMPSPRITVLQRSSAPSGCRWIYCTRTPWEISARVKTTALLTHVQALSVQFCDHHLELCEDIGHALLNRKRNVRRKRRMSLPISQVPHQRSRERCQILECFLILRSTLGKIVKFVVKRVNLI